MFHLVVLALALLTTGLGAQRQPFYDYLGGPSNNLNPREHQQPVAYGQPLAMDSRENNHYQDWEAQGRQLQPDAINFNHIEEPALQEELEQYINQIRVEPHNDDLFARETARVLRNQAQRLALWQAEKGAKKAELKRLGKQFLTVWQLMHLLNDLRSKKRNVFMLTTRGLLRLLTKKGQLAVNNKRPGK